MGTRPNEIIYLIGPKPKGDLDEATIGVIFAKMGNPATVTTYHANFFAHDFDQLWLDSATGKPIYVQQKPLSFLDELITLYSTPGDWILTAPSGAGQCCSIKILYNNICIITQLVLL